MTALSAHVLDAERGAPAAGIGVELLAADGTAIESAVTDADGRVAWTTDLPPGTWQLTFATGAWFAAAGRDAFHPEIRLVVTVEPGRRHTHVAVLLSSFAYTTYRGS